MKRDISQFKDKTYDLLVIGGGINGAAIAHLASQEGLSIALLEKGDFASGTSSKSTKLVHGGLRYLENLEFGLVYESLEERSIQLKCAKHLVKPLGFVIPVYKADKRPLWMMRLGVFLYDALAGKHGIKKHKALTAKEVLGLNPGLKEEGLTGGVMYYDAQMDDARLCLENVLMAAEYGAHIANYAKVASFIKEDERAVGVIVEDMINREVFEVRAKRIICALGPWTNEVLKINKKEAKKRVRTTKGVHIVYRGKLSKQALLIASQSDNRVFFVIPWLGNSLIGTTDTNYIGNPDHVTTHRKDIDYLFTEASRVFPETEFKHENIIMTFAGLRPLIRRGGSAGKVSRKHQYFSTDSDLHFVVGGKYTTYRRIAEDALRQFRKLSKKTPFKLFGGDDIKESPADVARQYNVSEDTVRHLMNQYGSRYSSVLALTKKDSTLKEKIVDSPPIIKAQLAYAMDVEMAFTKEDIIMRRLSLCYYDGILQECLEAIEEYVKARRKKNA